MEKQFIIKKVLNNNVVFSKNDLGKDVILTGLGLGYQKKKKDLVDSDKVERIFTLDDTKTSNKLSNFLEHIPIEYFYLSDKIKKMAEVKLGKPLGQNIYVTLCDHIYYAVERIQQGLVFQNQLMWEIKRFYQEEYRIALDAIKIINEDLNVNLPEDEASFIALHIINAEINGEQIQSTIEMTKLIKSICNIVQYEFNMEFDEDTLTYTRFILHLKFFSQRLMLREQPINEADFLYEQVQCNMKDAFVCAGKIAIYIKKSYQYEITKSELVYLTVHIQRLLKEGKPL